MPRSLDQTVAMRPWYQGALVFWPAVFVGLLVLGGSVFNLLAERRARYTVGSVVLEPVVARVPFRAVDQAETEKHRADARDREPALYDLNVPYVDQVRDRLHALGKLAADRSITGVEQVPQETRQLFQLTPEALEAVRLLPLTSAHGDDWDSMVDNFADRLADIPVLESDLARAERDPAQRAPKIVTRRPNHDREAERFDDLILDLSQDQDVLRERVHGLVAAVGFPQPVWNCVMAVTLQKPQPTYLINPLETQRRKQAAFDREPAVERAFAVNEVILRAGKVVTDFDLRALQEEQRAFRLSATLGQSWLHRLGGAGMLLILGLGLWVYIRAYNPRIAANPMRGLALTGLILLGQGLALALTDLQPSFLLAAGAFAVLLATIVLAIAYDPRLAAVGGAATALIIALMLQTPLAAALVMLIGAGVAAGLLDQVRTRSKILTTGIWAGLAMAAAAFLTGLLMHAPDGPDAWHALRTEVNIALAAGVLTGLVVQALLPAIERLFRVTTAMTLKDLNDASHPLLRRLAQEAPGTYQHSLRLSDLAQAAADSIGANSLLCKVGAMYHDVGKLSAPDYFVENQNGGGNPHTELSPRRSFEIIVGHVTHGMELARQYKLPNVIRALIESHHGTTVVEFFYQAACAEARAHGQAPPTAAEYRYAGPKPATREAALLMLCDSIESASRTLAQPDADKLEQLVRKIATARFSDNQLDECSLTLAQFHQAQEAIIKTLVAMYHSRVAYPIDVARQQQVDSRLAVETG